MKIKNIISKTKSCFDDVRRYFFRSNVTMSNTRYNMYKICPLKYKFYYEDGLKGFPSGHLHLGSAVHRALREYHQKNDMKGKKGTVEDLLDEYEKAWTLLQDEMIEANSGPAAHRWEVALADSGITAGEYEDTLKELTSIYNSSDEAKEFKGRGRDMLVDFWKDNMISPNSIVVLEKQLKMTYQGMDLLAYIDKIEKTGDGRIEVVDYKTGKRTKDVETIKLGGDTQAILYRLMVEKKWGQKLGNFYYYYLSNRMKVPCNIPDRLIGKLMEEMQDIMANIKYERYDASPGPLCGWCDYEVVCPEWKGSQSPFRGIFKAARERGRMTFSYSKMGLYKNCPYCYRKIYIDKVSPKPKSFFSIGHSCHEAMEEFFNYPYQSSVKQMRKMYEKHWHMEGYRDEQEEKEHFNNGWKWLTDYYEKYIDGQYIRASGTELYFQLPIGNDYVMIGYIDRLQQNPDGTYEILDYKTDPKLRTQEELDKDLQLTSYYWAMQQLGIDVKKLSLEFLQFNQRVSTERCPEDIDVFIKEVNKTVGEMESKEERLAEHPDEVDELFAPKVNKYCGGCDFLEECPLKEDIKTKYRELVMNLEDDEPKSDPDPEEGEEEDKDEQE